MTTNQPSASVSVSVGELIERVQAATGPDREIDAALFWGLCRRRAEHAYWQAATGLPKPLPERFVPDGLGKVNVLANAPRYTASLDAVLALVGEKLPGWGFYLRQDPDGCGAGLVPAGFRSVTVGHREGKTPALALLSALLLTLQAKGEDQ